jgi:ECF transporter S component (folate family)
MKKKLTVEKMTILAVLLALGAVLKMIEIGTGEFRISVFEIPLAIAGIIGGPIWGFFVAFFADGLYILVKGWPYSPLMSLSTALWGLLAFLSVRRNKVEFRYLVAYVIGVSILNFLINSVQLYIWYDWGFLANVPLRLIIMIVKWPILIGSIWLIYRRVLPLFNLTDKDTFIDR